MRGRALLVVGVVAVLLAVLWVANGVVAEPSSQGLREQLQEQDVRTSAYDSSLYPKLPTKMNYQGILRDDSGDLVNGSHDLTFTIYARLIFPLPGSWVEVYSETQTIQVTDGLFNAVIGSDTALDPGDFDGIGILGGNLELGVKVDGGTELSPRTKLLPVPYAFRAEYVNRYPAPHYNGSWFTTGTRPDPIQKLYTHGLGGDTDNYIVYLECQNAAGKPYQCGHDEAYWHNLTTSSVYVWICSGTGDPHKIRIRIWRTD